MRKGGFIASVAALCILMRPLFVAPNDLCAQTELFNYSRCLFGEPPSLFVWVESVDSANGIVDINGVDMEPLSQPFTWQWGDGSFTDGFFPQSHRYTDPSRNYVVAVIAHYTAGGTDTACVLVRFGPTIYEADDLPPGLTVSIPSVKPTLGTRLYPINPDLVPFDDSFFDQAPRETIEALLTLVATIQMDFTNDDVYRFQGDFEQVMLRDSTFGGAYSLWFTDPVSFGVGDAFLQGSIGYSSLFHEMGHNFTLNTPADLYYGGSIDGPANAIYSETMAQIYQHAAGYVLLNAQDLYGISDDLALEIRNSAISSMNMIREWYDDYVTGGMTFNCWDDPPQSATMETFMTIAFKFCEHAEQSEMGYRAPLKRMMHVLQLFDQGLMDAYDQSNDTPAADSARATLLVSALSFAFLEDYRAEFTGLGFPIDDVLYDNLMARAGDINTVPSLRRLIADTTLSDCLTPYIFDIADSLLFYDADGHELIYTATSFNESVASATVVGSVLEVTPASAGSTLVTVTADDGLGGYESTAFVVTVDADCGVCSCPMQGDLDGNGVRDAVDLNWVIDALFFAGPNPIDPDCPTWRSDFDGNTLPDAIDLNFLIDYLFFGGAPPVDPCEP